MDRLATIKLKVYMAGFACGSGIFAYFYLFSGLSVNVLDLLFLSLFTSIIPIAVLEGYESKMTAQVIDRLPVYFRDLVEMRKSGLSFEQCLRLTATRNYRALTPEIQRIAVQIERGIPLRTVISSFQGRVGGKLAKITATLLHVSIDVGGGSVNVLESLSDFVSKVSNIEKTKKEKARIVNFIMYFGQIILIMIILILLSTLEALGSPSLKAFLSNEFAYALFFQSVLVGVTAGALGSLNIEAGAKHALILSSITFIFAKICLGA